MDDEQIQVKTLRPVPVFLWCGLVLTGLLLAQAIARENRPAETSGAELSPTIFVYLSSITLLDVSDSVFLLMAFVGLLVGRSEYEASNYPQLAFSNLLLKGGAGTGPSTGTTRTVTLLNSGTGRASLKRVTFTIQARAGALSPKLDHHEAVLELKRHGAINDPDRDLIRLGKGVSISPGQHIQLLQVSANLLHEALDSLTIHLEFVGPLQRRFRRDYDLFSRTRDVSCLTSVESL